MAGRSSCQDGNDDDLNGGNVVGIDDRLLVDLGTGPSVQGGTHMYDLLPPERDFSINLDAVTLRITGNDAATHLFPKKTDTKMTTSVTIIAMTMYFHLHEETHFRESTLKKQGWRCHRSKESFAERTRL